MFGIRAFLMQPASGPVCRCIWQDPFYHDQLVQCCFCSTGRSTFLTQPSWFGFKRGTMQAISLQVTGRRTSHLKKARYPPPRYRIPGIQSPRPLRFRPCEPPPLLSRLWIYLLCWQLFRGVSPLLHRSTCLLSIYFINGHGVSNTPSRKSSDNIGDGYHPQGPPSSLWTMASVPHHPGSLQHISSSSIEPHSGPQVGSYVDTIRVLV